MADTGTNARTTISEFDGKGNPRRRVNPKGAGGGAVLFGDDYSMSATDDFGDMSDSTEATRTRRCASSPMTICCRASTSPGVRATATTAPRSATSG